MRKIIHVDMDAFYASVEQRDDPALRGLPLAVGGSPERRGVVAAASYEARAFGVRSAMPMKTAVRQCPQLVIVPPDFARYTAVSQEIREIFHSVTDVVEPLSLDEAYLDVTENKLGMESATHVAMHVRERIHSELGLTASAGVAPVKFVAKIASDYRKPDGLTVVRPDQVLAFISGLKVERLWGVGPATAKRIHELGVSTIGELGALPESTIRNRLGKLGGMLWRMANGDDPRPVRSTRVRKSRGAERTFPEDVTDVAVLLDALEQQSERIGRGLAEGGRTVTVKVRFEDFTTITRSLTLAAPSSDPETIRAAASELLGRTEAGQRPVRLIGVSLSGFGSAERDSQQLSLPFDPAREGDLS